MSNIANISGYKFTNLTKLPAWVELFQLQSEKFALLGTILLSTEGWNIALAGEKHHIEQWCEWYNSLPEARETLFKYSYSDNIPFKKLIVKIKNEIIRMNQTDIEPQQTTGKYLPPQKFKDWLDQGKPIIILDTRNDYEVWFGHFKNAIHFDMQHFTQFPERIGTLTTPTNQPIVTYCTGGIRCEKATSLMLQAGFTEVYQLQGGILNYFQQCGGQHYEGECFVFDERISLDSNLAPTTTTQCSQCQRPLPKDSGCSYCHLPYNPQVSATIKEEL
jgi:UPF0176 protein